MENGSMFILNTFIVKDLLRRRRRAYGEMVKVSAYGMEQL